MARKKSGDFCPFLGDLDRHIWSGRANGHRRSRARMKSLRRIEVGDGCPQRPSKRWTL
jgi:hypothetical protein